MPSRAKTLFDDMKAAQDAGTMQQWLENKINDPEGWYEGEYLDFKSGEIAKDKKSFRKTIAEYYSAFSNTEGGILLIGIDTKRDDSTGLDYAFLPVKAINDVDAAFKLWNGMKLDLAIPNLSGIESIIHFTDSSHSSGLLIIYIPESKYKPVRSAFDHAYHQRVQDSCKPINHELLRSLFYPQNKPYIQLYYSIVNQENGTNYNRSDKQNTLKQFAIKSSLVNEGNATAAIVNIKYMIYPAYDSNAPYIRNKKLVNEYNHEYSRTTFLYNPSGVLHPSMQLDHTYIGYNSRSLQKNAVRNEYRTDSMGGFSIDDGITVEATVYAQDMPCIKYRDHFTWQEILDGFTDRPATPCNDEDESD